MSESLSLTFHFPHLSLSLPFVSFLSCRRLKFLHPEKQNLDASNHGRLKASRSLLTSSETSNQRDSLRIEDPIIPPISYPISGKKVSLALINPLIWNLCNVVDFVKWVSL